MTTSERGNTKAALDFIGKFRPSGTICLVAIVPDGATETRTFSVADPAAMGSWIEARQGVKNIYFTVNRVKGYPSKKPTKDDIEAGVGVWIDLDPNDDEVARPGSFVRERQRIDGLCAGLLLTSDWPPTFMIDSGGGFQLFWMLKEEVTTDGKDGNNTKTLEALGKRLALRFGGDHVENIDRIMRLPGTVNIPNKKKRDKGRKPRLAKLINTDSDRRYSPDELRKLSCWEIDVEFIEDDVSAKLSACLLKDDKLFARWLGDDSGLHDTTRSGLDMSVGALLKGHGFTRDEVAEVLRNFPHGKAADLDERDIDRIYNRSSASSKSEKSAQRDQLLAIGLKAELWHDPRGAPFASINQNGHIEHHPIDSGPFKNWLINAFLDQHNSRIAPTSTAVSEALGALMARASNGAKKETFVRVGGQADKVYFDLGNESWDAIEIDAEGWRVVPKAPVPMLRYSGMESLPHPVRGGHIEELQEYVNAPDDDAFKLVVSFCVTSLFPHGPYVLLEFAGPSGSLKSSATRALKRLIDPNKVDLRSKPRSEEDLSV